MKRRFFTADLHMHSCLSPCGQLDMTPKRIIEKALAKGLEIIAIADHNSAENLEVASRIASERGICLLPAMEITSAEEAHVLALFENTARALRMQQIVYDSLPAGLKNDERLWGEQVIVNERDEVMGFNTRLLLGATSLTLNRLVAEIHALGGLAVASHVDREAFSVVSQLGFIPDDIDFDALEVVNPRSDIRHPKKDGVIPLICSSDAHQLEDIGKKTTRLFIDEASFGQVASALREGGRRVLIGED